MKYWQCGEIRIVGRSETYHRCSLGGKAGKGQRRRLKRDTAGTKSRFGAKFLCQPDATGHAHTLFNETVNLCIELLLVRFDECAFGWPKYIDLHGHGAAGWGLVHAFGQRRS